MSVRRKLRVRLHEDIGGCSAAWLHLTGVRGSWVSNPAIPTKTSTVRPLFRVAVLVCAHLYFRSPGRLPIRLRIETGVRAFLGSSPVHGRHSGGAGARFFASVLNRSPFFCTTVGVV